MKTDAFNERKSDEFPRLIEQARRALEHRPINNLMADVCEADRDNFHLAAKKIGKALTKIKQGRSPDQAIQEAVDALSYSGSPQGEWFRHPAYWSLRSEGYSLHRLIVDTCNARAATPKERLEAIANYLIAGESQAKFYLERARAEGRHRDYLGKTDKKRQSLSWNVKGALVYLAWAFRVGTGRVPTVTPQKKTPGSTFTDLVIAFCEEACLDADATLRLADEHRELVRELPPQWEDVPPDPDSPWAPFQATGKRLVLPK